MSSSSDCVFCFQEVRPRQEALLCDGCNRWQHRVCQSGITRPEYRRLVKGEDFAWFCANCRPTLPDAQTTSNVSSFLPAANSTAVDEEDQAVPSVDPEFDISLPVEEVHDQPQETSLIRTIPDVIPEEDPTVKYEVLASASKKGGDLLTDSLGFTYCLKRKTPRSTTWRCSQRAKSCLASVIQREESFERGIRPHNHGGDPGAHLHCKTRAMVSIEIKIK